MVGTATIGSPPGAPILVGTMCVCPPASGNATLTEPSVTNPGTGGFFTWYTSDPSDSSFPTDPAVRATYAVTDADAGTAGVQIPPSTGLPNTYYAYYINVANCSASMSQNIMPNYTVTASNPTCAASTNASIAFTLPTATNPQLGMVSPANSFMAYDLVAGSTYTGSATASTATSGLGAITVPQNLLPAYPAAGASQNYTIRFFDKIRGCFCDKTVTIARPAVVVAGLTNAVLSCGIPSATLTASGGTTYTWSSNVASSAANTATVNMVTTYTVTATVGVCSSETSVTLTGVLTAPTAVVAAPATITCGAPSFDLDASASTGVGAITYNWATLGGNIVSNGMTATPTIGAAGISTVTVSANGCTATSSITVAG
jgi:hypothetical protein